MKSFIFKYSQSVLFSCDVQASLAYLNSYKINASCFTVCLMITARWSLGEYKCMLITANEFVQKKLHKT